MSKSRNKGPVEDGKPAARSRPGGELAFFKAAADRITENETLRAAAIRASEFVEADPVIPRREYHFRFPHNLLPGGVQVFSFRHYPEWTVEETDGWIWFRAPRGGGRTFRVPVSSISAVVEG
jgi:hypothetical protein